MGDILTLMHTTVTERRVSARDALSVPVTVYEPGRTARATVVIHGATAAPQRYYGRFASYLADAAFRVVTYDYRGVGASRPASLRGFAATMTDWARLDAVAVLDHVRAAWREPLVHVGHSFGGQILGLLDETHDVEGALLVGSQLPWTGHWKPAGRLRVELAFRVLMPLLTRTFGYLPGWAGIGEDLPAGVAHEWASWCLHPDYLIGAHPDARGRFARFERPVLLYSFTDDSFAPRASVERLVSALSGTQVAHRRVAPSELGVGSIGHFGFFRPRFEHSLWRDARGWIETLLGFEASDRRPLRAWDLDASDIERDLMYGRAE